MKNGWLYIRLLVPLVVIALTCLCLSWQIDNDMFMINETVSVALLLISLVFNDNRFRFLKYVIFCFLVPALFNITHFSYTTINGSTTETHHSGSISFLGINPIVLLIIPVFMIVNRKLFVKSWVRLRYGSEKEIKENAAKEIDFYYYKFKRYPADDLKDLFKLYKDYPKAAQIALDKIKQESELRLA